MARALAKLVGASTVIAASAVGFSACLDPTQITLKVRSSVACESSKGTSFTGGASPTLVERAQPNTITMACNAGDIGTLVATPSGEKESAAAFMVVQGVSRPVSECAANDFNGCIVARRILRYIPHTPLTLPIAMHVECIGKKCSEFETCVKSGKCVSATIADPEQCANGGACVPEGEVAEPDPPRDGGPVDGNPTSDGPSADGPVTDGPPADAPSDAPPPSVMYCPLPNCARGQVCCWSRSGNAPSGECASPPAMCPRGPGDLAMRCTRRSDCNVAAGEYCCGGDLAGNPSPATFPDTHCQLVGPSCQWICYDDSDCPQTPPAALPMRCSKTTGYFTPPGFMGVCVSGPIVEMDAAAPL